MNKNLKADASPTALQSKVFLYLKKYNNGEYSATLIVKITQLQYL